MDQEEKIVGCMGSVAGLSLIPTMVVFEGFCLSVMWKWFFVPLGIQGIGIAHAVGITAMIAVVAHQLQPPKQKVKEDQKKNQGETLSDLLSLLFASFFRVSANFVIAWIAVKFI